MTPRLIAGLLAAPALLLAGCVSMDGLQSAGAPEPSKPIDIARFYTGRWYEIARTPMSLTKDCVAGTTDYTPTTDNGVLDTDACRMDTPDGKVKTFAGPVTVLNPGQNTKVRVGYKVFGVFTVDRTYWMEDHGDDYGWFIVTDPKFDMLSLFTRDPRPSRTEIDDLTARAKALGYDVSKLEYPTQFPAGQS